MIIRPETKSDYQAVHAVNSSAFETNAEAKLVDVLRIKANPVISLVAEENEQVIGHILFTPVTLTKHSGSNKPTLIPQNAARDEGGAPDGIPSSDLRIMGLAPMAVLPDFQRKEIGSALVRAGLEQCQQLGYGAVVVLGHPKYYPRFGFSPSSGFGIKSEYDVPEEVFMVTELLPGYLKDRTGTIKYHPAFGEL